MTSLRISICLLLAALAAPIFAQDFSPYVAEVTGDSVRLRSGPSLAHPPVHVLALGDKLTVVAEQDGWAVVRLPAGAPCWIAAEFVQASGKTWVVTGNKVNLRVTADTKYFAVGQADTKSVLTAVCDEAGTPVVENGFARVVPPAQATGAVSVEFIKRTSDAVPSTEPAQAEVPVADVKAEPKAEPTPAPVTPLVKKDDVRREPTAKELEDERKTLAEIQRLLDDELKKPAEQIKLTSIRKMFEQFEGIALSPELRAKADEFILKIDATVKLIDAEKARLDAEAAKNAAEFERIRKEAEKIGAEPVEEPPKGPVEYIAIGTVGSHGKTARTPASHRLFDENGNIVIDLRMDKGDLSKYMGSRVGVVGEIKEYVGWPQKVILITRIDVIDDGEDK